MAGATIEINMDKPCSRCGKKGSTQNGLCLECITDSIVAKGKQMEVKIVIRDIENLKTSTAAKVEKDKDGNVTERRVMTRVQFDCEVGPTALANVVGLLATETPVHVIIGSPQAIIDFAARDGAFAEV